jgi:hypothetical protein
MKKTLILFLILTASVSAAPDSANWEPTTEFVYRYDKIAIVGEQVFFYFWNPVERTTWLQVVHDERVVRCAVYRWDWNVFPPKAYRMDVEPPRKPTKILSELKSYLRRNYETHHSLPAFARLHRALCVDGLR